MFSDIISRAMVTVSSTTRRYSVAWRAYREARNVEYLQPQGVHFRPPENAQGVMLSCAGDPSAAVLTCASGSLPTTGLTAEGEGGLHYMGEWRVYLDASGKVHLGARNPGDWVALASKCDANFTSIQSNLAALETAVTAMWTALSAGLPGTPITNTALAAAVTTAWTPAVASIPSTPQAVGSTTVKVV